MRFIFLKYYSDIPNAWLFPSKHNFKVKTGSVILHNREYPWRIHP